MFGRTLLATIGTSAQVAADGNPEPKIGGVTLDPTTVAAAGADGMFPESWYYKAGDQVLRHGQVVTMIGVGSVQTLTIATATGGTFTVTVPASTRGPALTTAPIAWNATAAAMKAALEALWTIGANNTTVTLAGSVWTVTLNRTLGDIPQFTTDPTLLTPSGTVTVATTTAGLANSGLYGPYDPAVADGRQFLNNGEAFILNRSVNLTDPRDQFPEAIYGGRLWLDRIIQAGTGTASLAAGPTLANFLALFPRVQLVKVG